MPALQAENVADLVADTLKDLGKPKFTDISSSLQNHVAMKNLLRKNRVVLDSGEAIQFNVLVGQSSNFQNVSPLTPDAVAMADGMIQGNTVWRNSRTAYMVVRQFMAMNREPARIVDYIKQQRIMALIGLAEGMETNFWAAPSASDTLTPNGLPYWVTKNATAGFNGGTLSGWTDKAGIKGSQYSGWNNYTFPYTFVSKDDFIRSLRKACRLAEFLPPVEGIPTPNTGDDYGHYTCYGVMQPLEEVLESQNDNLGSDIASQDGNVHFRRRPVTWVPWLERDTTNPWYSLNWGYLKTYILRGEWLRETAIPVTPGMHNVHTQFIDLTYNFVSKNVRCHIVGSNGTTYP